MDDDTQQAAEHQQMLDERRRREADGWEWWPQYHDALVARQHREQQELKELARRLLSEKPF